MICSTTSRLTTFSDGVRGKSANASTDSGHVYLATPSRVEEDLQLLERRGGSPVLGDDRRAGALAEALVGQRHDRDVVHRRVAEDDRLELGRAGSSRRRGG